MRRTHLVTILVLLALALPASPVHAGGVVSVCDEAHLLAALAGGGTVTFACSGTITLTAEIVIAADTTIEGSGQAVTISGNNAVRVFSVNSGVTLNLDWLTVANGAVSGYPGGGGIYNHGTLTVSNSIFSGNSAYNGGGIYNANGTVTVSNSNFSANSTTGYGGAILNDAGTLTVSSSIFDNNSVYFGGGSISNWSGMATISNSTFSRNNGGDGGGIYSDGELTISNSSFEGNSSARYYGSSGGGIYNEGTLTVSDSTFAGNSTTWSGEGGAIYGTTWTSEGGAIQGTIGTVNVTGSAFSGNSAGDGGAIAINCCTLTVNNSTFSGNMADSGIGGIHIGGGDTMAVANSSFYSNTGAIYNSAVLVVSNSTFVGNNSDYFGGGIYNYSSRGRLTVSDSTFSENSAPFGGAIGNQEGAVTVNNSTFSGNTANYVEGNGGGIRSNGGIVTVSNSTFIGNSSVATGGGIVSYYDATVTVINCTFSGNSGGGIYNIGTVTLRNTIVAASQAGENCSGIVTDGGGNLSYPDTTCPGINADPVLGPLQDNGGPTWTMALLPGSPAIDAAVDATCAAAPVNNLDQRGIARPQGAHCDIGAVERYCPSFVPPGTVGVEDIVAIATRWGWTNATPGWDAAYDLNGDDKIDIVDIMLVNRVWGGTCS